MRNIVTSSDKSNKLVSYVGGEFSLKDICFNA